MNQVATILLLLAALGLGGVGCLLALGTAAKLDGVALMIAGLGCLGLARLSQASDHNRELVERLTLTGALLAPPTVKAPTPPMHSAPPPLRTRMPTAYDAEVIVVRNADMPPHLKGGG